MNPVIKSALDEIDLKIKELEEAKRVLRNAFGIEGENKQTKLFVTRTTPVPQVAEKVDKTRKDEVASLLRKDPGLSRGEIQEKTGIPVGTISFVLNDKETFGNRDGKWYLKEQMEGGTTIEEIKS